MRATVIHGPRDVRSEDVAEPALVPGTDAVVRVVAACVCSSDLWSYRGTNPTDEPHRIGHEFVGVVEDVGAGPAMEHLVASARPGGRVGYVGAPHGVELPVRDLFRRNVGVAGGIAPARAYLPDLLADVWAGRLDPSPVFDLELALDRVADAYAAMDERRSIKTLLRT